MSFENALNKRDLVPILGIFLLSRLCCSIMVYWGHARQGFLTSVHGGWEGVAHWWLNPWTTFDSQWYLQIAADSYQHHTTAFFPLYPFLLSLAGENQIHQAALGISISSLAFFIALILVFRLTSLEHGRNTAFVTVWVMAFLPAAPFFSAVYTESLFLALLAGTFLFVRLKRWWLAGILGALAALTRNPGFLISLALLIEVWINRDEKALPGRLIPALLPLAAFAAVQLWFWFQFNNPLAGVTSQEYFSRELIWPWIPLLEDIALLFKFERSPAYLLTTATALLFTLGGMALVLQRSNKLKSSYLALILGILLMNLTYGRTIPPHTVSSVRYLAVLFPFSQALALGWQKLAGYPKVQHCLTAGFMVLFLVYSFMFGNKGFIG